MQRYADIMNHFGLRSQMKKLNEETYEFLEAVNNYEALIFENECYDNVYTAEELEMIKKKFNKRMKEIALVRMDIVLLDPETLERYEGKATRVVDLRYKSE